MHSLKMTPFDRINAELLHKGRSWRWLSERLITELAEDGPNVNAVNHWRKRGVPAKFYRNIEKILAKPLGWATGEQVIAAVNHEFSGRARDLAIMLDAVEDKDLQRILQAQCILIIGGATQSANVTYPMPKRERQDEK
jgi:hypothetical protein